MKYVDVRPRIENFAAWIYLFIGGRTTGKTYSALKMMIDTKSKFVFLKRTMDDVDLMCATTKKGKNVEMEQTDLSPFKPLNRDLGTNIRAVSIEKGLGAFYEHNEENNPVGAPIGYIASLSGVTKFKGFDMSECDYIIFDEFIPNRWERINRLEGEQILDLYITVSRDRELRGLPPLKIICLANATNASNPVCNMLEVTDDLCEMQVNGEHVMYIPERGIYLERLESSDDFNAAISKMMIYNAMKDTQWGQMAFGNSFGYDDFSNVQKQSIKKMRCVYAYLYKQKATYVYKSDAGLYYVCASASAHPGKIYDLDTDAGSISFYYDVVVNLRNAVVDGRVKFQRFLPYDIIMNYKKYFAVR